MLYWQLGAALGNFTPKRLVFSLSEDERDRFATM